MSCKLAEEDPILETVHDSAACAQTPSAATLNGIVKEGTADTPSRTLEVVISTSTRDRQGDVIESAGLDFTNFLRNPVVLWAHDQERPPVARVLGVQRTGDEVRARVEFADTPFAKEVFSLYSAGFLRAWSIGFLPVRWRQLPVSQGGGRYVESAEVVELSAVPVPANPEALTKALELFCLRTSAAAGRAADNDLRLRGGGIAMTASRLEKLIDSLVLRCLGSDTLLPA